MPGARAGIIFILISSFCSCSNKYTSIFKKDFSHRLEARNTLIAFVGEKISWEPMPYEKESMYVGFKAKYKIVQMVYGKYRKDIISFEAYDHYGVPSFLHYKNALLFVNNVDGKYYHETYIFNDVYKTTNGKWASPFPRRYGPVDKTIKSEKIDFVDRIAFATSSVCSDRMIRCFDYMFPSPYYRFEGDSAIAEYGNYIGELFLKQKEGPLTYRGRFGDSTIDERGISTQEVAMEDIPEEDEARVARFKPFAEKFADKLTKGNFDIINKSLPDSIYSCDSLMSKDDFIKTNEHRLFNADFMKEVKLRPPRISDLMIYWSTTKLNLVSFGIKLVFKEVRRNQFELSSYSDDHDPNCNKEHYDPANNFSTVDEMMMGN